MAGYYAHQCECAPEKQKISQADENALGPDGTGEGKERLQYPVRQHVGPRRSHNETLDRALLYFGRQPCVVEMAGQIACLDTLLPKARNEQRDGHS